jgi:transposase
LPDDLWEIIEPVLHKWTPSPNGGQPRLNDRKALTGILFVLKTGIAWEDLPGELGCGCGMTCWRRLREWQVDGTWTKIHKVLLDRLPGAHKIAWSRATADCASMRAACGGDETGPSPVGRAKSRKRRRAINAANGIPPAYSVPVANINDTNTLPTPSGGIRLVENTDGEFPSGVIRPGLE